MKNIFQLLSLLLLFLIPIAGIAASAQQTWDAQCVKCHGADGNGKTKMGIKLRVKDYTDRKTQAEFSENGLLKNLLMGISAEGETDRMPAFKDKLTTVEAKELIALIRSFKK